jgi:hypothetical protein
MWFGKFRFLRSGLTENREFLGCVLEMKKKLVGRGESLVHISRAATTFRGHYYLGFICF